MYREMFYDQRKDFFYLNATYFLGKDLAQVTEYNGLDSDIWDSDPAPPLTKAVISYLREISSQC
jgi:hypothetical protein